MLKKKIKKIMSYFYKYNGRGIEKYKRKKVIWYLKNKHTAFSDIKW